MDSIGVFGAFSHAYYLNSDANNAMRVLNGLSAALQAFCGCYSIDISDYQNIILKNEHPDSYFTMEYTAIEARSVRVCEYDAYTPKIPRKISFTGENTSFKNELTRLSRAADQKISQEVMNDPNRQSNYMAQLGHARDQLFQVGQKSDHLTQSEQFAKTFFRITPSILRCGLWPQDLKNMMCDPSISPDSHLARTSEKEADLSFTPLLCELIDRTTFAAQNFLNKAPSQQEADLDRLSSIIESRNLVGPGVTDKALKQKDPASLIELSAGVAFAEVFSEVKQAYQAAGGNQADNSHAIFRFYQVWLTMNKPQWQ